MSTTATTYSTTTRHTLSRRRGTGFSGIATASTPNLNQLYSSQLSSTRLAPPPLLPRKASFAALTHTTLAAIPDDTESYANDALTNDTSKMPIEESVSIGDAVDVPGGMLGTIRFIGTVQGRKGTFAGVELNKDFAARGKNSGDVDGVSYFTTIQPGAGIFLPLSKAVKHTAAATSPFPMTPTATTPGGLKVANQNSTNFTPPTPSIPKFSQSVGGPGRASSPIGKRPPRASLPRPESPVRKLQLAAPPRQSMATPGPKASKGPTGPTRFGSPNASNKFAQSVRSTAGDPNKRLPARDRKGSIGPRSASALGNTTASSAYTDDDETTPVGPLRTKTTNGGSVGSLSSFAMKARPSSRAASRAGNRVSDEEVEKLKTQLEDRNRQLKDQAATLAEMESSLTELQGLIENSDVPVGLAGTEDSDAPQLRALLREKNEKIAMLTTEFDAHRADFRSTIDTLEMASTETERVYEKRMEELMQEVQDLQERTADVDTVAAQLKQLEELVQELEEGLEDARRGEAEARGEVEFLRGEVERTRSELRREREKAQNPAASSASPTLNGDRASMSLSRSKELEQKEDEIRGLKAIIHSLSRDSVPADESESKTPLQRGGSIRSDKHESIEERLAREKLEREVAELRAVIENQSHREEELELEIENMRRSSVATMSRGPGERSSIRDSRGTVVLAPEIHKNGVGLARHSRTLDPMPESDSYSTATENSTLWCEICETGGHDILTCSNMFGSEGGGPPRDKLPATPPRTGRDVVREGLKKLNLTVPGQDEIFKPAPLSPIKTKAPSSVPETVRILPNPMDSGPVAGKESGHVDSEKWCALCERDGHDSVDCPFEDAF